MSDTPPRPSASYRPLFEDWDKKSWVRSKEHRIDPFEAHLDFYPESLTLLFSDSRVKAVAPDIRRKILGYHLQIYLDFTVWLELGPVNEICNLIRQSDFLGWLPSKMKNDAFRIYVDEGGHAEMSHALKVAVLEALQIRPLALQPAFLRTLDELIQREQAPYTPFIKLFFVVISETLITGTLNKVPSDETVQLAVRELTRDHAADESRHHGYFRSLFEHVWPRLPMAMRRKLGLMLPDMILAFLSPDRMALASLLREFPEAFAQSPQLLDEVLALPIVAEGVRSSARPTLNMLKANGVFDDPDISARFEQTRLLLSEEA